MNNQQELGKILNTKPIITIYSRRRIIQAEIQKELFQVFTKGKGETPFFRDYCQLLLVTYWSRRENRLSLAKLY